MQIDDLPLSIRPLENTRCDTVALHFIAVSKGDRKAVRFCCDSELSFALHRDLVIAERERFELPEFWPEMMVAIVCEIAFASTRLEYLGIGCQTAFKRDPLSASKRDPLFGYDVG